MAKVTLESGMVLEVDVFGVTDDTAFDVAMNIFKTIPHVAEVDLED